MNKDFEDLLAQYKSNYVQFLSTGNTAYKTAYENAQDAIENAIQKRQAEIEEQKHDMKHFAKSYEEGNNELSDIYDSASGLFQNAQTIEDTYRAAKERYESQEQGPAIDISTGYAFLFRFGLILIILPIIFLVWYWVPSIQALLPVQTGVPTMSSVSQTTSV